MMTSGVGAEVERPCPYKGLFPFCAEDAGYFFGRGSDADLIAANILSAGVLILHGPSGVGKSSVLEAALPCSLDRILPDPLVIAWRRWDCCFYGALLRDAKRQGWGGYRRYVARHRWPESDDERELFIGCHEPEAPPLQLEQAPPPLLRDEATASASEPAPLGPPKGARPAAAPHALRTGHGGRRVTNKNSLERCAELWAKRVGTPVVFVFDQFEQYFIGQDFGVDPEDATFEADLARIVKRRDLGIHVLISIREDALHELNRLRARIPNILVRSLKLGYLDEPAAREAINGPLRVWLREHDTSEGPSGARPELVDALIQQVSRTGDGGRIETPYLQLALKRLWEEERRQGSPELRSETLTALDGASGIAKSHFESTMKALPEDDQRLCATIFDRMVTPSGMKIALSAADLARLANKDPERVRSVLEELANGPSRIINCVRSPKDNQTILYEIFHDVLARPIRDWIAAQRERVQQQEKLEKQRREAELEHARQQKEIVRQQHQIARENHLKRLYFRWFIAAGIGFLLASVFAGVATYEYRDAAKQKARAIAMRANAAIDSGDNRLGLLASLAVLPEYRSISQWVTRPIADEATQALAKSLSRPLGVMLQGHAKRLWQVAFSPDGKLIATASEDGSVRLWDAQSGRLLQSKSGDEVRLPRQEADELRGGAEKPPPVTR